MRAAQLVARLSGAAAPASSLPGGARAAGATPSVPRESGAAAPPASWEDVIDAARGAIVRVHVVQEQHNFRRPYEPPAQLGGRGSGFFFRAPRQCDAYAEACARELRVDLARWPDILTNAHVVRNASSVHVQLDPDGPHGKTYYGVDVVCFYGDLDVAVLRLDAAARADLATRGHRVVPLEIGDTRAVRQGAELMTIGHPLGVEPIITTKGTYSGRTETSPDGLVLMQTDAPINHGNSGGPLLARDGRVVGITSSGIPRAENTGFAVSTDQIHAALSGLEARPQSYVLRMPRLGAQLQRADEALLRLTGVAGVLPGTSALLAVYVLPGSPLGKAGAQQGDVLYEIDGRRVDGDRDVLGPPRAGDDAPTRTPLAQYLAHKRVGERIEFLLYRLGRAIRASAKWRFARPLAIDTLYPNLVRGKLAFALGRGLVLCELSLNLLEQLLKSADVEEARRAALARFLDERERLEPRLVVAHVVEGSEAARQRILAPGMLVAEVNGQRVGTLDALVAAAAGGRGVLVRTEDGTLADFAVAPRG